MVLYLWIANVALNRFAVSRNWQTVFSGPRSSRTEPRLDGSLALAAAAGQELPDQLRALLVILRPAPEIRLSPRLPTPMCFLGEEATEHRLLLLRAHGRVERPLPSLALGQSQRLKGEGVAGVAAVADQAVLADLLHGPVALGAGQRGNRAEAVLVGHDGQLLGSDQRLNAGLLRHLGRRRRAR